LEEGTDGKYGCTWKIFLGKVRRSKRKGLVQFEKGKKDGEDQ
jgi:hypothetical protein